MSTRVVNYIDYWTQSSSYSCQELPDRAVQLHNPSRRNLLIWEDCGAGSSVGKDIRIHTQMTNQTFRQNTGLVLNYRVVDPLSNPRVEYHVVSLNRDDNRVQLLRFNGQTTITEHSVTPGAPFVTNHWYQIDTTVTAASGNNVQIAVQVSNLTDPAWPTISFSVLTSRYGLPVGHFGLYTNRAISNFAYFGVSDA